MHILIYKKIEIERELHGAVFMFKKLFMDGQPKTIVRNLKTKKKFNKIFFCQIK